MHTYIGGVHLLEAYLVRFKIKLLFCCLAKAMLLGCNINAFRVQKWMLLPCNLNAFTYQLKQSGFAMDKWTRTNGGCGAVQLANRWVDIFAVDG